MTHQKPVLRFGIAGLGVASTQILAAFERRPHLQAIAAADVREEGRARFRQEYEGEAYDSVDAMCENPNVDAVYVCTPNHLHCEHVITACEHGKHVIVEKPMALTLDECERMNAAAERSGVRLLCGHTHSFDPPVRKMREMVKSGELGKLGMINTWHFNEFMYRARMPQELDPTLGGNIVYNQGPHQVDIVRLIAGGMVRSVRAMTGIWDPARRAEGAWSAYIEFEDGTPATLVYNGYAHFDSAEFTEWAGEGPRDPDSNLRARRNIAAIQTPEEEWALKEAQRYGGARARRGYEGGSAGPTAMRGPEAWLSPPAPGPAWPWRDRPRPHQHFGVTIVSCEHGDIRQSPYGLYIYGDETKWEAPVPMTARGREAELEELYEAVVEDRPVFHDGRWGEATLEVVLAIMESARQRRELFMSHQVATPE